MKELSKEQRIVYVTSIIACITFLIFVAIFNFTRF